MQVNDSVVVPTLRQLECFVAVADEGSFTRAAAALHISQPGLSSQIAGLERDTGTSLFERRSDGAHLTPMGRVVLVPAREALSAASRVSALARRVEAGLTGSVTIATVYSASLGILPPLLRMWQERMPNVNIRLREHRHANELREAMTRHEADLALGPSPALWEDSVYPYLVEQFVILHNRPNIVSLADASARLPLTSLAQMRWVHFAQDNGLAEILENACRAAGFTPDAAVRVEQTASAVSLAEAGLGPTLVPESIVPAGFTGHVHYPESPVGRDVAFYTRGAGDALVRRLVQMALDWRDHREDEPETSRMYGRP